MRLSIRYRTGGTEVIGGIDQQAVDGFVDALDKEAVWIGFSGPNGVRMLFRNEELSRVHIDDDPPLALAPPSVDPADRSAL